MKQLNTSAAFSLFISITILFCFSCKKETKVAPEEPRFFSPSEPKAIVFNDSTIRVSWKDNSNEEVSYQVQRKVGTDPFKLLKETAPNDTVLLDVDVSPNTLYTYRVRAIGKSAETSFSDEVTAKLDLPIPVLTSAIIDDSKVKLTWTDNSVLESGFVLERSKDGQQFVTLAEPGKNIQTYTDTTIKINTTYTYRIKARNKTTETNYSNIVTAKANFQAPALNYGLPGGNVINLLWTDNAVFEKGYIIEQSINDGDFKELTRVDSQVLAYKIENLQPVKKYAFRIKAYSAKNISGYSNIDRIYYNDKNYTSAEFYQGEKVLEGQITLSPSTYQIATTGSYSRNVILVNRSSHTTSTIATNHTGGAYSVKFSPDNANLLVSGGHDGNIEVWSPNSRTLTKTTNTGMEAVYCLTFNKSGTLLAAGGTGSSKILVYDFPAMTLKYTLTTDNHNVRDVLFYENDTKLISCGNNNKVQIWNLTNQQLERTLTGHTGHVGSIDLNANSSLLASASYEDETVRVWNPEGGLIQTIFNSANISSVFFDQNDNIYFTDYGGKLSIVNKSGVKLFDTSVESSIYFADFNKEAKIMVSYNANGGINVFQNVPVWMGY